MSAYGPDSPAVDLPTDVEAGHADLDGLGVRYLHAGNDGPPVVLLHGGGMDAASVSWRTVQPALAGEFRTFAPDWPGFGESDPPERGPTTDYYVEVLARLLSPLL